MSEIEDVKANIRKYSSVEIANLANIEKKLTNAITENSKDGFLEYRDY